MHIHLKNISELNKVMQNTAAKHPLVAVVDFTKVEQYIEIGTKISTDFYSIMFKNYCSNKLKYGREYYDFQEGNLICIAPKQIVVFDDEVEKREDKMGWGLFFHPDLIRNTSLGLKIQEYTFFNYDINEALHLSDKEKQNLYDCIVKIESELNENIDDYSQSVIVSTIELFLNYCTRYYGRQFITRKAVNSDLLTKTENIIQEHFRRNSENTMLSVKSLAEKVHLSPNYLGDLLKKETGMNAQELIHYHLIEHAKTALLNTNQTINEIAYSFGFEYPQYFSKLFKQKTGHSPVEFRNLN